MENNFHKTILRRCNELAMRARGRTSTNPNVGAVVYDSDHQITGEGWHRSFGGSHAEIHAINSAGKGAPLRGQAIAVNLEPCNHTGKTPACTKAISDKQLVEVLIDQIDPDERMSGQSVEMLRHEGLSVPTPLNTTAGKDVIHPFSINTRLKRPYLRLKMAISADHFIGQPNQQVKISNALSDRWVHRLRNETQAIMVGTQTLLNDNPSLTSRYGNMNQPIRILPDRRGILPGDLKVFMEEGANIILTTSNRSDYHARILRIDPFDLSKTFQELYRIHIGSILIEGGSRLFKSLINQDLWDELILIQNSSLLMKSGTPAPKFPSILKSRKIKLGDNRIIFINNPNSR